MQAWQQSTLTRPSPPPNRSTPKAVPNGLLSGPPKGLPEASLGKESVAVAAAGQYPCVAVDATSPARKVNRRQQQGQQQGQQRHRDSKGGSSKAGAGAAAASMGAGTGAAAAGRTGQNRGCGGRGKAPPGNPPKPSSSPWTSKGCSSLELQVCMQGGQGVASARVAGD